VGKPTQVDGNWYFDGNALRALLDVHRPSSGPIAPTEFVTITCSCGTAVATGLQAELTPEGVHDAWVEHAVKMLRPS
jgi:hypothetical protein